MDSLASRARSATLRWNRVCDIDIDTNIVGDDSKKTDGFLVGYELTIRYKWRPFWAVLGTVVTSCKLARVLSNDPQRSREFSERWILRYEGKMDPIEYKYEDKYNDWWDIVLLLLVTLLMMCCCSVCGAFTIATGIETGPPQTCNVVSVTLAIILVIFMLIGFAF